MTQIKINPTSQLCYIPDEIHNAGFTGEVSCIMNANSNTVVLIKPGVKLDDVIKSLELMSDDLKLAGEFEG